MTVNEQKHFENIARLYSEYQCLFGRENVEVVRQTLKDKIVIEVCKIFYLDEKGYSVLDDQSGNIAKKENKEYSEEIFITTYECFKYFENKKNDLEEATSESGMEFAKYVYYSVDKKLKYLKGKNSILNDNKIKIPREKLNLISKIRREDSNLSVLINDKEKRLEMIKKLLDLGDDDFKELYFFATNKTKSLDETCENDDSETSVGDFIEGRSINIEGRSINIEESVAEGLIGRENLIKLMSCIQQQWEKKKDLILSDLLTVYILENMFGNVSELVEKDKQESVLYDNMDIFEMYSFLNREMVDKFFHDTSYKLPSQIEIGTMHGGVHKSTISKKLSRFFEQLKKIDELKNLQKL